MYIYIYTRWDNLSKFGIQGRDFVSKCVHHAEAEKGFSFVGTVTKEAIAKSKKQYSKA